MTETTQNIAKNKIRYDLEIIASLIKPNAKVLDIGCGNGELLNFLKKEKNSDGRGLEISQSQVSAALTNGVSVIQGNAEEDLSYYPDQDFDFAILSQTIQATRDPKTILREMLRVAKFAIISFPNFAHYRNRFHLLTKGTMPVSKLLPFQWYETPNIHFCSIKDFEALCQELHLSIQKKIFLTSKHPLSPLLSHDLVANFFAEYGVFLVTKQEISPTYQEEYVFNNNRQSRLNAGKAILTASKSD